MEAECYLYVALSRGRSRRLSAGAEKGDLVPRQYRNGGGGMLVGLWCMTLYTCRGVTGGVLRCCVVVLLSGVP